MKKILFAVVLCTLSLCTFSQTYVWKNGHPLVTDPDSITFVKPDLGLKVYNTVDVSGATAYQYLYLTKDYTGAPVWMSAELMLSEEQISSKHISWMALYNHYTISRSDECPTAGNRDLQNIAPPLQIAVVSADYEGFGETGDRVQAYCFGEANARASIDALLAAREWLVQEGYTLSDSIINYGYSQGGQTTVAALKLSQGEYRGKVHFMRSFAGAGPYDLRLTYRKFEDWQRIGQAAVLPLTVITVNELEHMNLDYKKVFKEPLASNVKSWVISKKFSTDELTGLFGSDSLKYYMQPAYMDSTSAEMSVVLKEVDKQRLTTGWVPDADTDIRLYHSVKDDIVGVENSLDMYKFFEQNGVSKAVLDTTTLTDVHLVSGQQFAIKMIMEFSMWKLGM